MPGPNRINAVKAALLAHYGAPPAVILRRFRNGAFLFATGLIIIVISNSHYPPSLQQELAVLGGLVLTATGFVIALLAELRFIIGRLLHLVHRR